MAYGVKKLAKAAKNLGKKKLPQPAGALKGPAKDFGGIVADMMKNMPGSKQIRKLPGSGMGPMMKVFYGMNPAGPPLKKIESELEKVREQTRRNRRKGRR